MDFERKLDEKQKCKSQKSFIFSKFKQIDWSAKVKAAVPLTIYLLVLFVLLKLMFDSVFKDDNKNKTRIFKHLKMAVDVKQKPVEPEEMVCV
jgi:hypothetical protein